MTNLRKAKYHKEPMRTQVNNITRLKQRKTGVIYCILFTGGVIRDIWTNQRNSFFFFFSFSKTKTIEDYFAY